MERVERVAGEVNVERVARVSKDRESGEGKREQARVATVERVGERRSG